jgi:hypothetical protein
MAGCASPENADGDACMPVNAGLELADAAHLSAMRSWAAMPTLRDGVYVHHGSRELEPADGTIALLANGNRDMNNFVCASADASKADPDLVPHAYELAGAALGSFSGPFNFLEGDPTIRIDGRDTVLGTGTEELFDGAFYFDEGPHAGPFSQAWGRTRVDAVPATGSVSACRWHAPPDTIDFHASISMDLEIGPGMPGLLDRYRSVAFVYRRD